MIKDTTAKIENMQAALFQKAGTTQMIMRMQSLSQSTIDLSRRAIARSHPEFDKKELDLFFVRLHYGDRLADRLEAYLNKQKQ